jgi:hypothetical protein
MRDSDNWQKGMGKDVYIKSGFRHFMDWWMEHRGQDSREGLQDALCALLFNTMGYLYEDLKGEAEGLPALAELRAVAARLREPVQLELPFDEPTEDDKRGLDLSSLKATELPFIAEVLNAPAPFAHLKPAQGTESLVEAPALPNYQEHNRPRKYLN